MGRRGIMENGEDNETKKALLNNHASSCNNQDSCCYEANKIDLNLKKEEKEDKKKSTGGDKKKKNRSTWAGFWKKIKLLWPYMWPSGDLWLQMRVILCVIIILVTRILTVMVPLYYKKIVTLLTPQVEKPVTGAENTNNTLELAALASPTDGYSHIEDGTTPTPPNPPSVYPPFCWEYILIFILLKSLHGSSGYLNCLRSFLWISITQFTKKRMTVNLFAHLHSLSMNWHTQRKTGEVLKVMDRGVNSINLVLNHILFNIAPVIADIIIAIVFFMTMFNVWTGLIVFVTMFFYLVFTIGVGEWRTKFRRQMNESENEKSAASLDSILNFETVKYYSAEDWEVASYEKAVDKHLQKEGYVTASLYVQNAGQKTLQMICMLCGSLLIVKEISNGTKEVGDFVLYILYLEQLYRPLDFFGTHWRTLQQAFIDMESMLDMMEVEQDIVDAPGAKELAISKGAIEFKNVKFFYNEQKPIIKGMNFTVPPGQTFALVGNSGGGKSTLVRLLFRLYDIQGGSITIDGQDISMVTQKSLRTQIGVVPQDTVLFNKDIMYNIRYGRHEASDEEVKDAAVAADIHDRIVGFPDGYESRVGERGLKLSGGEKQRIAIARTMLKSPQIVLLDEATSALDTRTERNIQASLQEVCKGKTSLIVAHRLSTIINVDQILVIHEGEIVERGTHDELLQLGGAYCEMWSEQLQSEEIGDIGDDGLCACCPIGAGHGMDALIEKLGEVEKGITPDDDAKICCKDMEGKSTQDNAIDSEQVEEKIPLMSNCCDAQTDKIDHSAQKRVRIQDLKTKAKEIANGCVRVTRPNQNGMIDKDNHIPAKKEKECHCICPCHIAQEVYDVLSLRSYDLAPKPAVTSTQTNVQGKSLTDIYSVAGITEGSSLSNLTTASDDLGVEADDGKNVVSPSRGHRHPLYSIYDRRGLMSPDDERARAKTLSSVDLGRMLDRRDFEQAEQKEREKDENERNTNAPSVKDLDQDLNCATCTKSKCCDPVESTLTPTDGKDDVSVLAVVPEGKKSDQNDTVIKIEEDASCC